MKGRVIECERDCVRKRTRERERKVSERREVERKVRERERSTN